MTVCRECQHPVSQGARTCPSCGVGLPSQAAERDRRTGLIGLLACLLAYVLLEVICYFAFGQTLISLVFG